MSKSPESAAFSASAIDEGYRSAARDLGQFNLGLFGITGAGKSTLVNAIFGVDLAATGIGAPVTQTSTLHRREANSLGIFDTKGLELGTSMADTLVELTSFVDANRLGPESDQLHVMWYCVRAGDRRIQPAEEEFIRGVARIGIPVILVMTQVPLTAEGHHHPEAVELAEAIRELRLPIRGDVFFVNALADDFAGVGVHGLDELLTWTEAIAPEGVRNALAAAQQVNARLKAQSATAVVTRATNVVRSRALKRGITGAAWVAMFAEIAAIYGISESASREILESSEITSRLRRLIHAANAGVVLMPTVALIGVAGSAAADAGRRASARWRGRSTGGDDAARVPEKRSLGVGWVAARATRDLGEAWRATCEHYWTQTYPQAPTGINTGEVAARFAAELQIRLPPVIRQMDARRSLK